jgi:hypothetical protein
MIEQSADSAGSPGLGHDKSCESLPPIACADKVSMHVQQACTGRKAGNNADMKIIYKWIYK